MSFKFDITDWKCLEKSSNQFVNKWNHKINVRPFIQNDDKVIIFHQHGIWNHCNRVMHERWAERLHKKKIALVLFDHVSHGQSDQIDGEWGQFNNADEMYQTITELIDIVLGHRECTTVKCIRKNMPFFLSGMSLGGGLAAIATNYYENLVKQYPEKYNFKGSIQIAPAFDASKPPQMVLQMLRLVAYMFPKTNVPTFIKEDISDHSLGTSHIDEMNQVEALNIFPMNKRLQFRVAMTLIDMLSKISSIRGSTFPILIMIDPEDKVVDQKACVKFCDESTSKHKKVVDFLGERHDLIFNCFDRVNDEIEKFIKEVQN